MRCILIRLCCSITINNIYIMAGETSLEIKHWNNELVSPTGQNNQSVKRSALCVLKLQAVIVGIMNILQPSED